MRSRSTSLGENEFVGSLILHQICFGSWRMQSVPVAESSCSSKIRQARHNFLLMRSCTMPAIIKLALEAMREPTISSNGVMGAV